MPLPADLLPPAPDGTKGVGSEAFLGGRWAVILPATLLVLFGLTVISRSLLSDSPVRAEAIVQMPVSPEISAAASAQRSEASAPDPGDNLP